MGMKLVMGFVVDL